MVESLSCVLEQDTIIVYQYDDMIRLWYRLISMDNNRLTKCVFNSDYTATGKTWCSDLKKSSTSG